MIAINIFSCHMDLEAFTRYTFENIFAETKYPKVSTSNNVKLFNEPNTQRVRPIKTNLKHISHGRRLFSSVFSVIIKWPVKVFRYNRGPVHFLSIVENIYVPVSFYFTGNNCKYAVCTEIKTSHVKMAINLHKAP